MWEPGLSWLLGRVPCNNTVTSQLLTVVYRYTTLCSHNGCDSDRKNISQMLARAPSPLVLTAYAAVNEHHVTSCAEQQRRQPPLWWWLSPQPGEYFWHNYPMHGNITRECKSCMRNHATMSRMADGKKQLKNRGVGFRLACEDRR